MPDLSFIHVSAFYELTALLALAAAIGFVGLLLRQPMIVSFIAVGVLAFIFGDDAVTVRLGSLLGAALVTGRWEMLVGVGILIGTAWACVYTVAPMVVSAGDQIQIGSTIMEVT